MKIYKYTIITFILFLLGISNTYASCTQEEINNFKKVEDEYTVKYEFDKVTKTYTIYFKMPTPDKYIFQIYSEQKLECIKMEDNTTKCIKFVPDEYEVEIIDATRVCSSPLKTINLKLPEYNKYSEDPLCKGVEEFVLCSPTYGKEIDYETFVSRVKTYKNTKLKQEQEQNTNKEKEREENFFNRMIKYIETNIIQIIVVIVFVLLLLLTAIITIKSIRKSRRLE